MKLRAPAVPLITIDPYFSVWSFSDRLNDSNPVHWTGKPNTIQGVLQIDGEEFAFWGVPDGMPRLEQTGLEIDALSTCYTFTHPKVKLTARFLSPLLMEDPALLSRPVSFLELTAESQDGQPHQISARVAASEELCLNTKGQSPVESLPLALGEGLSGMKLQNTVQQPLHESGDDIRIDWGAFCLTVQNGQIRPVELGGMSAIEASVELSQGNALFAFGYDDVESLVYFGAHLKSYWNKDGQRIENALTDAFAEYETLRERCREFSRKLSEDAAAAGGEQYAELLSLAYRQVVAAHKLAVDENGEILWVSKECFSNGCAATVDVSYPSIPLFLLYNPELVKGMMRPIFRYAASDAWPFDFAPHDAGQFPLLNGQVYANGTDPKDQMPVEECGNMLVMMAAVCLAEKDASFAKEHLDTLKLWAKYLLRYGADPENQLCTDDFAGHLAHNCNLSLKAIMGIGGLSILLSMLGETEEAAGYLESARSMAAQWIQNAANGDGSFRLAFDQPNSFSMKYNAVWDKLFGLNLFPAETLRSEFQSYSSHTNRYGLPLDNRADYTKSDWLVWCASYAESPEEFAAFIAPLWQAYHESESRVPLTDWYDTKTGKQIGFQNRTVQGGLFIRLLEGRLA